MILLKGSYVTRSDIMSKEDSVKFEMHFVNARTRCLLGTTDVLGWLSLCCGC